MLEGVSQWTAVAHRQDALARSDAAIVQATTLGEARENLRTVVEEMAQAIEGVCRVLEAEFDFRFGGIDFSLAPYPEEEKL